MGIEKNEIGFLKRFLNLYYDKQDRDSLGQMLDEGILWFESGEDALFTGAKDTLNMIQKKWNQGRQRFYITDCQHETQRLSQDLCLILLKGCLRKRSGDEPSKGRRILVSAICQITPQDEKLCFFNVSNPSEEIGIRNQELQMLTDNIPGAIFCCRYDKTLEIIQMSDSFLKLFGYQREEIEKQFHNSFWELIDARDRDFTQGEVKKQIAVSDTKELEYRIKKKNGESAWVLDKGRLIRSGDGTEKFYCVLVDITKGKLAQEELEMSLERHQIIMDQTNDIIFEWDIIRDKLSFSDNWEKKFHYKPLTEQFYSTIDKKAHVYPDDLPEFKRAFAEIKNGVPYMETEVRVKRTEKDYIWCKFRLTSQYGKDGSPSKAVGVIIDIDDSKKSSQKLLEKAERDPLTKLYNKETSRCLIESYIDANQEGHNCAFIIIDIDDFKLVNDTLGHLFGDAFLVEVTRSMKKLFRASDVLGRIGGDEFIAFMKDIVDEKVVIYKAMQIVETFHKMPLQHNWDKPISCSIGIVIFPQYGTTFNELFKKADQALYQAKKLGKNGYALYDDKLGSEQTGVPYAKVTSINEKIDSDDDIGKILNNKLAEYVFRILYRSMDVEAAVEEMMETIGRQYHVSRVYIFENTEDDQYCCNTFEWCSAGVRPEKLNLKKVSYEKDLGGNYVDNFNADGIFYCPDIGQLPIKQRVILEPQGIKSMLQCAITDNGKFHGFVGFDECRMNRLWTQEQITSLIFVSQILSTFLLKKRAQDKAFQSLAAMQEILDNQNAWIYVIDLETYEMHYVNRKTRSFAADLKEGMCCYSAIFKRDKPCQVCPSKAVFQGRENCTYEIYNPEWDLWLSAEASLISWQGKKAGLVTCHDISKYKMGDTGLIKES